MFKSDENPNRRYGLEQIMRQKLKANRSSANADLAKVLDGRRESNHNLTMK